jgi:hypothetical protein
MIVTVAGALGVRGRIDPLIFRRASWNPLVTHLDESERPAQDNGRRNSEIGKLMKSGCLIGVVSHGTKGHPPGSNVPSLSAGIRFRAIADVGLYRL